MSEVVERVRQWEVDVIDYESLSDRCMDEPMKVEALLRNLPQQMYELAMRQNGLDRNFKALKDYVLHQAGRRSQLDKTTSKPSGRDDNGPSPMVIGAIKHDDENPGEEEIANAFWWGKAAKGGKWGGY